MDIVTLITKSRKPRHVSHSNLQLIVRYVEKDWEKNGNSKSTNFDNVDWNLYNSKDKNIFALVKNFANEKLDGFVCSKTKKEIDATRSLSIEELPPILILHLKRFVYDANTGGVQKILKQIEFSVDLEVSKSILSAECRASNKQRQYKLFSVVYHNGREATKGHYVTDIFHTGYSSWLHCDDSQVSATCEQSVLAPSPTSTPYILLYRRGDTIVGMDKKSQS